MLLDKDATAFVTEYTPKNKRMWELLNLAKFSKYENT